MVPESPVDRAGGGKRFQTLLTCLHNGSLPFYFIIKSHACLPPSGSLKAAQSSISEIALWTIVRDGQRDGWMDGAQWLERGKI